MVVMEKYRHKQEPEEEYIDLIPILKNSYMDASQFLEPIKEVRLAYGGNNSEILNCSNTENMLDKSGGDSF